MDNYDPKSTFASDDAARGHDYRGDETEAVNFLRNAAGAGPALELAIGTGRIALPLAASGLRVDGVDFSSQMLGHLRNKPGGSELNVTLGNFVDFSTTERYSLIFILWNSLFNVLTQEDQVRCFENAESLLTESGSFVVEAFVPSRFHRLANGSEVATETVEADSVRIGILRHEPASQIIEQSHVTLSGAGGIQLNPVVQRYAWPSELDLMARIAGLKLQARWGGWMGEPYTSESRQHVSVYGR